MTSKLELTRGVVEAISKWPKMDDKFFSDEYRTTGKTVNDKVGGDLLDVARKFEEVASYLGSNRDNLDFPFGWSFAEMRKWYYRRVLIHMHIYTRESRYNEFTRRFISEKGTDVEALVTFDELSFETIGPLEFMDILLTLVTAKIQQTDTTHPVGREFAQHVAARIRIIGEILPAAYLPMYTAFVRSSNSKFYVGSTASGNSLVENEYLAYKKQHSTTTAATKIKAIFRRFRILFLESISSNALSREQGWHDAMVAQKIKAMDAVPTLNAAQDPFTKLSQVKFDQPIGQVGGYGVVYSFVRGDYFVRCLKCYTVHQFMEVPLCRPDKTRDKQIKLEEGQSEGYVVVALGWTEKYTPGKCGEVLAMSVLEYQMKKV